MVVSVRTSNKLNQTWEQISQILPAALAAYDSEVVPMGIPAFSPIAPLTSGP